MVVGLSFPGSTRLSWGGAGCCPDLRLVCPALGLLCSEDRTEAGSGLGRLLVKVENNDIFSSEPVNSTIFILNIFLNT